MEASICVRVCKVYSQIDWQAGKQSLLLCSWHKHDGLVRDVRQRELVSTVFALPRGLTDNEDHNL